MDKPIKKNKHETLNSQEVAKMVGKRHDNLVRDIDGYVSILSQNSKLRTDDFFIEDSYTAGTGKNYRCYQVTKMGCDFIAHKLNGVKGTAFTATYVKRFYEMKQKLIEIRLNYRVKREISKIERRSLTDSIKELPPSPHKEFKYKHYTDLFYKIIFGKNAQQLRAQFGITKKEHLRDYFTPNELHRVTMLEKQAGTLIDLGLSYQQIKKILINKYCITA
jgi:Rha family phage regulatory protein